MRLIKYIDMGNGQPMRFFCTASELTDERPPLVAALRWADEIESLSCGFVPGIGISPEGDQGRRIAWGKEAIRAMIIDARKLELADLLARANRMMEEYERGMAEIYLEENAG